MPEKVILSILWLVFQLAVQAEDWPQWRGRLRDGVWRETGTLTHFRTRPPLLWRAAVSNGYSGPTVAEGRVYLTDRVLHPKPVERVSCFDAAGGRLLWQQSYDCNYPNLGYPDGPRASVSIDSGRAYSLGAMGHLYCWNAADGRLLWHRDLFQEYKIRLPIWGIAAAPLVDQELVIVQIGGRDNACLVAFNKKTGREIWRALADEASYSAPILLTQVGKRVLVCWTGQSIAGLNPQNGQLYWTYPFPVRNMIISVATPVWSEPYLLVTSFYDGALLLRLNDRKMAVEKVWRRIGESERRTDALHSTLSTPVIRDGYIYGVDSYGELRCLRLDNGDRVWENLTVTPKGRWANAHLIPQGEWIWLFNEKGELIISRMDGRAYREIDRVKLVEPTRGQLDRSGVGVSWSHPAFAGRKIFLRTDNELVCYDLTDNQSSSIQPVR